VGILNIEKSPLGSSLFWRRRHLWILFILKLDLEKNLKIKIKIFQSAPNPFQQKVNFVVSRLSQYKNEYLALWIYHLKILS